jgi:hypothetical protein
MARYNNRPIQAGIKRSDPFANMEMMDQKSKHPNRSATGDYNSAISGEIWHNHPG